MRSRPSWVWPFLLSVLCGTIITLLLAIVGPWWENRYVSRDPLKYVLWLVERPGNDEPLRVSAHRRWFSESWVQEYEWGTYYHAIVDSRQVEAIPDRPYWFVEDIYKPDKYTDILFLTTRASGWPLRALMVVDWSGFKQAPDTSIKGQYTTGRLQGYETDWRLPWLGRITDVIPLRPIWPGLLLNIAIWSAASWCCFSASGLLKRSLRRRRGLCPACAYDLRASTTGRCPECGTVSRPSRQTA